MDDPSSDAGPAAPVPVPVPVIEPVTGDAAPDQSTDQATDQAVDRSIDHDVIVSASADTTSPSVGAWLMPLGIVVGLATALSGASVRAWWRHRSGQLQGR